MQKIAITLIDTRKPLFGQLDDKKEFCSHAKCEKLGVFNNLNMT